MEDPKDNISKASMEVIIKNPNLLDLVEAYLRPIASAYTKDQVLSVKEWAKSQVRGYGLNSAMICNGKECPLYNQCPLALEGKELPVGKKCPFEHLNSLERMTNLLIEFGIDPYNPEFKASEFRSVIEIIQIEIIIDRIVSILGKDGICVDVTVVQEGIISSEKREHPLLKFYTILSKRREEILKEFKATRASLGETPATGKLSRPISEDEIKVSLEEYD